MNILLLGQGVLAVHILQALLTADHCHCVAVIRCDACSEPHANQQLRRLLEETGMLQIDKLSTRSARFKQLLSELRPDAVLLACWGEILTQDLLKSAATRFINCHPSLLPKHRGPNPYHSVIQQQESQTGVSFHIIDSGIDTGPVLLQQSLSINSSDNINRLRKRCALLAGNMIPDLLQILSKQDLQPIPQQQLGEASYFPAPATQHEKIDLIDLANLDRVYP